MDQEGYYVCSFPDCSSMFSKPSRLLHHERTHTGERPYVCPHEGCLKSYTRPAHLTRHIQSHDKKEPVNHRLKCEVEGCTEVFTCKRNLEIHRQRFHEKLYKCLYDGCGKAFKKHNLLKCHRAEHTNENPFKCKHEGCTKSFPTRSKLKRHEKTHEGFKCSQEGCDKVFDKWSLFRKHMAVDHKPDFKCDECGKTFATKQWMKQHAKTHLDNREVIHCTYEGCPRVYYCSRNLAAHIRSYHEGQRPACDICKRTFANKHKLENHKKLHDPNRPMPKKKSHKKSMVQKLSGMSPAQFSSHSGELEEDSRSVVSDSNTDVQMPSQNQSSDSSDGEDHTAPVHQNVSDTCQKQLSNLETSISPDVCSNENQECEMQCDKEERTVEKNVCVGEENVDNDPDTAVVTILELGESGGTFEVCSTEVQNTPDGDVLVGVKRTVVLATEDTVDADHRQVERNIV